MRYSPVTLAARVASLLDVRDERLRAGHHGRLEVLDRKSLGVERGRGETARDPEAAGRRNPELAP